MADNGSTDDLQSAVARWTGHVPGLRIVDASGYSGVAFARNIGVRSARGRLLAFCDDDDQVQAGWLAAIAEGLQTADVIGGGLRFIRESPSGELRLGPLVDPSETSDFLPYGVGGNLATTLEAFEHLAGFDPTMTPAEDVDYCWRAQLTGFSYRYQPSAVVAKARRGRAADVWRQHYGYGKAWARLYRRHGPHGMQRNPRRTLRQYWWLLIRLPFLYRRERRLAWARVAGRALGRLAGSMKGRIRKPI